MMNQQQLDAKYREIHALWMKWSDKQKAMEQEWKGKKLDTNMPDFSKIIEDYELALQNSNLCYVFLHALKFVGASSEFETDLNPFQYKQKWTGILQLP